MWPSNGLRQKMATKSILVELGGRRWLTSFLLIATIGITGTGLIHAAWPTTFLSSLRTDPNNSLFSIDRRQEIDSMHPNKAIGSTTTTTIGDNNQQNYHALHREQHENNKVATNSGALDGDHNVISGGAITIDDHRDVALPQQQDNMATSSSIVVDDNNSSSSNAAVNNSSGGGATMTTNSIVYEDNNNNDAIKDDQMTTNPIDDNVGAINDDQSNVAGNNVINDDNGGTTKNQEEANVTNSPIVDNDRKGGEIKNNEEENVTNSPIAVLNDVNGSIKDFEEILPKNVILDESNTLSAVEPEPVPLQQPPPKKIVVDTFRSEESEDARLEKVLKKASMRDKTVIVTTSNAAWSTPGSILDLFLESFKLGRNTNKLLKHLVIVALDGVAYSRCKKIHPHCFALISNEMDLSGEKVFMTPGYLTLVWRKLDVLKMILEKGYNFIFSDADILWFRNPMLHLYPNIDFQVSCDKFNGRAASLDNLPNTGFKFVKSNNRTIAFYRYWYESRLNLPGQGQQGVFNVIKYESRLKEIGVTIRFLSPSYYGGLCSPSKDLTKVSTMHVNCCIGLESKVHDLKVMLEDWRKFKSLSRKNAAKLQWSYSQMNCLRGI